MKALGAFERLRYFAQGQGERNFLNFWHQMTRGNFSKVSAILDVSSAVRLLPRKRCEGTLLSHATARGKLLSNISQCQLCTALRDLHVLAVGIFGLLAPTVLLDDVQNLHLSRLVCCFAALCRAIAQARACQVLTDRHIRGSPDFATVINNSGSRRHAVVLSTTLHTPGNVHSINDTAEDTVLAVQMWAGLHANEELRRVRVLTTVGHAQDARRGVL
mmetsp:Transcript_36661/g.86027  ORF Transcript_36661/g.86027 Transcript_36661/m.86027 type:complete len:217 (-) Transcript_36661:427-1077(-)